MTTVGQCCNRGSTASRMIILYTYLIVSYRGQDSTMIPCITAATATAIDTARHSLLSDSAMTRDDDDNDSRKNENLFYWLDEDDDYNDDDDDDDLSLVRIDKNLAERMTGFFDKLNLLRRRHREKIRKSKFQPFGPNHQSVIKSPFGNGATTESAVQMTDFDHHVRLLMDQTPLIPSSANDNQQTSWDEVNGNNENRVITDGNADPINLDERAAGIRDTSGDASTVLYSNRVNNVQNKRLARDKLLRLNSVVYNGYLHMGWNSARCLLHQYYNYSGNNATMDTDNEQETLQSVRKRLKSLARFWTIVVGISIMFLWAAFGCFHELFCIGIITPPDTYAKDVNRYLTMVPPHVVVTNKAKMFRYQPTVEERYLWKTAKKIANFKI